MGSGRLVLEGKEEDFDLAAADRRRLRLDTCAAAVDTRAVLGRPISPLPRP
jgi:hypothetical protein